MTTVSPNTPIDPATLNKLMLIQEGFSFLDAQGNLASDLSAMTDTIILQVDVPAIDAVTEPTMYYVARAVHEEFLHRNTTKRYDNPVSSPTENVRRLAIKINLKKQLHVPDYSPTKVIHLARKQFLRTTCPRDDGLFDKIPLSVCFNEHAVQGSAFPCGCDLVEMAIVIQWE
ncbi:uncharacterized protein BDW47DRAFT_129650 [Aspergillus candidus]|uniref:Uncharacterized protein n=1 Tax=Aspergillus candidus TaxID=41067 RepID=A0A2I2EZG5_ASPCN|nr:hypothetical protein BDW47DRAFT_129650 [Aspergillus candidus]PLB33767.1 hypothetical protein BDW47DRAFT_129650 [Aspergillus candidus]